MLSESSPPAIEDGAAVELIDAGNLAAIVSSVPSTSYDEMSLAEHLTDPSWTALRAMRHENVVEHFAKRTSVVPLRFGTIYLERARIKTMLSDNNLRLTALLERLRNREEWGVNVYLDKNLLMATITSLSPRLKDLTERAANASPGESYLLKKRIETMKADELLKQMRRQRTHQAIVIDEYGGTAGLVTFERVMERIVGDLGGSDFDAAASTIRRLPDGSHEVDGLALVTDINERFNLGIDEETYTTIGGYMLGRLGRRPQIGDIVEAGRRTLNVQAVDGLRVSKVRIV